MITEIIVFFSDTSTLIQFSHSDFTVCSLGRDNKFSRLIGFAPDIRDAITLIIKSFPDVGKIDIILPVKPVI